MKKIFLTIIILGFALSAFSNLVVASEKPNPEYNNDYCYDVGELEKWQKIIEKSPNDDNVQTLHALWIGLCQKVEQRQLTVDRANRIFERARQAVIKSIPQNDKPVL